MRFVFGLGGILISIGVIVMIMHYAYLPQTQQVITSGNQAREVVEQIAGVDTNLGGRVSDNITLEPAYAGSRLIGITVKTVAPGSSYVTFYGIRNGDLIDQVGPQSVRDIGDAELTKAQIIESYQRKWELGVQRGGQHLILPIPQPRPATPPPPPQPVIAPPPTPAPQPTPQPAKPKEPYVSPLQRQLDAIQGAGSRDQ